FRPDALTVDEPALRHAAGAEFAGEVPAGARDATRRNLLSSAVLAAEQFPVIQLYGRGLRERADGSVELDVAILLRGAQWHATVPAQVRTAPQSLVAAGEFELRQSAIGLEPFSVLLGALAVRDAMRIKFAIVARRCDAAPQPSATGGRADC
ncbi:MAG: YceI family protein, partial [Steroidobacteraceae bacterium]|nr:YceI family protein [Steroidobacteraceae bacterium]